MEASPQHVRERTELRWTTLLKEGRSTETQRPATTTPTMRIPRSKEVDRHRLAWKATLETVFVLMVAYEAANMAPQIKGGARERTVLGKGRFGRILQAGAGMRMKENRTYKLWSVCIIGRSVMPSAKESVVAGSLIILVWQRRAARRQLCAGEEDGRRSLDFEMRASLSTAGPCQSEHQSSSPRKSSWFAFLVREGIL
jgi:hypothetical protein